MEQVIRVEGLKKYYKEIKAVDDISFTVESGELFGFLGVNGAGKSTTINMLCTLYPPTAGEIEICGHRLGREDGEIRKKIGVVWQNNCLDERLTVKENLYVRGALYGQSRVELRESVDRVCDRLGLSDIYGRLFGKLSGGQKRRCEIAAAIVNTPRVLFLDEPTTGLDPATRLLVWESLDAMRREDGVTIFLTTHYMEEAARASHIAVMDQGRIREFGTPFALKERFAMDKLKLIPREGEEERVEEILKRFCGGMERNAMEQREEYYLMALSKSLEAMPILRETEKYLKGFELIQGSMDDAFLSITGKTLKNFN